MMSTSRSRFLCWLALAALVLGAGACQKADRLLLLDVRASGGLPTTVSAVRFSATGWPTRAVAGVLGPGGLLFGYYGPSGSGPVTVTAEAIDAASCVLGAGSATVLDTSSGQTAPATVLYVRPLPGTNCTSPDAGFVSDAGDAEAGADGPDADAASSDAEAGTDAGADARVDAGANLDVPADRAADTGSPADAGTGIDTGPGADAGTGAIDASSG
jgi:hypothetical protein